MTRLSHVLAGVNMQLDRVFKAAVGFLEEGSLDARTYGKRIIWQVSLAPSPARVREHFIALLVFLKGRQGSTSELEHHTVLHTLQLLAVQGPL